MRSRTVRIHVYNSVVLWLLAQSATRPLMAQASLGAADISGSVRDEQGSPVVDARITLTDDSKAMTRESSSDSSGAYLFPSIGAGMYTIRFAKTGFALYQVNDLSVEIGQRAVRDVVLRVGEVRTTIVVSASGAPALDEESNVIGTVIDSARVTSLPLNGRNFLQLAFLSGGTAQLTAASNTFTTHVGPPGRTIILPATMPYSVGYWLDGVPIRGSRDGELALNISIAAIDQFKVQESFLMPDQGPNPAMVNVVTKSGGNQLHGEVFEFLRNGALDARSFFALTTEDLKQNQFGFGLGGPVWKDHVWFHSFYEGLRQITGFSVAGYSPTAAMFGGNLAEISSTIYDPDTYSQATGQRRAFPGNIIPLSRINPVSTNLSKYYLPGSSLASQPSNVFGHPRNTLNDDQGGLHLDAAISSRQQLFAELFWQNSPVVQPGLYPISGLSYTNQSSLAILKHSWTISPHAVNTARIAFVRSIALGSNQADDQGPSLNSIGVMNAFGNSGISAINVQGFSSFGQATSDVGDRDNTWHLEDAVSYIRGNHSLKFGAQLSYRRGWHSNGNATALGALTFQPTFTAQLIRNAQGQSTPQSNTGNAWADFLLGLPTSGTLSGLPVVQYRATEFQPFVQDTWKITPNLTLNYGLAWYVETPPDPQGSARNLVHGFDPTTGLLTLAALGQVDPKGFATDWNNFAPRVGIAWKPRFLKNPVVRAGAGSYYSEFPWVASDFSLLLGSPIGTGQGFTNVPTNPLPQYQLGKNVFPPLVAAPLDANYAANLPQGSLVTAINPALRSAYVNQWNASIQQTFARDNLAELSYLGASGHRLTYFSDLDQCRPVADLFCNPATRPWPRYSVVAWMDSNGNSSYEALIAKYQHRASRGLNLLFEYTFGKSLTDSWQSSTQPYGQIAIAAVAIRAHRRSTYDNEQSPARFGRFRLAADNIMGLASRRLRIWLWAGGHSLVSSLSRLGSPFF